MTESSIIESISAGEPQEIIIILDETAAVKKAAVMRTAAGASHDTTEIVGTKAAMYSSMKMAALSAVSPQEVENLKDYKRLPVMFLKAKSLSGLQKLAAQPGVKGIYPNRAMKPFLAESLPLINQPAAAAAGYIGTGTTVAVLDTGVDYSHAAFGACGVPGDCLSLPAPVAGCSVACVHDFAADDAAADDDGHGTNVSAIVRGVAPGAGLTVLDVFDGASAFDADILAAIDWVIENKAVYNIAAINMSIGVPDYGVTTPCPGDPFAVPLAEARDAGILSAVAAGNDGFTNKISSPACVPAAVSVGAVYDADLGGLAWGTLCTDLTTAADQIICFSNNAYYTTLLAPGALITAGGSTLGGTSMAAPHAAGAIAVLRGDNAFPSESADITVNRLVSSGVPVRDERNSANPIVKPRLDLNRAVNAQGLWAIMGSIRTAGGQTIANATVTVTGPVSTTTTTDVNGNFNITGLPAGTYIVTPSKLNFTFKPASKFVSIKDKNIALLFKVKTYAIKGSIKPLFRGVSTAGIKVTVSGCDIGWIATTNIKGQFNVSDLPNCNYAVVPDKTTTTGHSFTPDSRAVTVYNKSVKNVSFTTP